MLFAQVLDSSGEDDPLKNIGEVIAEGVSEGVKEGLAKSSENAPTNWILMFAAVSLTLIMALAIVYIVIRFIHALHQVQAVQNERDREHRQHVKDIQSRFDERDKRSQKECHDHSKEIVGMSKEAIAALSTLSGKLESTATHIDRSSEAIEKSVHGIRNVLQEHHNTITLLATSRAQIGTGT